MRKSIIYIIMCTALLSACQDENTFGPGYQPDKMGHMMKVDHADLSFAASGGTQTIQVRAMGPHWKFDGIPSWLSLSSTSGQGDMAVTFTAEANTSTSPRTATFRFMADERDFSHSKDIKVTQAGKVGVISIDPAALQFERISAAAQTVTVTCNEGWSAAVEGGNAAWCEVRNVTATAFDVAVADNQSFSVRTATITVTTTSGKTATLTITQKGGTIGYEDYDEDEDLTNKWQKLGKGIYSSPEWWGKEFEVEIEHVVGANLYRIKDLFEKSYDILFTITEEKRVIVHKQESWMHESYGVVSLQGTAEEGDVAGTYDSITRRATLTLTHTVSAGSFGTYTDILTMP